MQRVMQTLTFNAGHADTENMKRSIYQITIQQHTGNVLQRTPHSLPHQLQMHAVGSATLQRDCIGLTHPGNLMGRMSPGPQPAFLSAAKKKRLDSADSVTINIQSPDAFGAIQLLGR